MKISRFEDIRVWQHSRSLVAAIYALVLKNDKFRRDFALKDQIQRAAISIMSNIAEGYARRSDKAFSNFLHIAHGSSTEVQSQLYIALDVKYIDRTDFNTTYAQCEEISRQIHTLIQYLSSSPRPPSQNS